MSGKNGFPPGLAVEVIEIGETGLRLDLGAESVWLSYADFPWFISQPTELVRNVQRPSAGHLYWPALDIDLSLASIRDPAAFPLMAQPHFLLE